jgi:tRNA threonylcarbamoyl adenosine modification protein YeaZ
MSPCLGGAQRARVLHFFASFAKRTRLKKNGRDVMNLLVWDTSSKQGSLGAYALGPVDVECSADCVTIEKSSEFQISVEASTGEHLLWGLDQCLKALSWTLKDIQGFVVGVGPGSFTGLRIGIATGRTLSFTNKIPLVGFSSLSARALALRTQLSPALLPCVTDLDRLMPVSVIWSDAFQGEVFFRLECLLDAGEKRTYFGQDHVRSWESWIRMLTDIQAAAEREGKRVLWYMNEPQKAQLSRYTHVWSMLSEFGIKPQWIHETRVLSQSLVKLGAKKIRRVAWQEARKVVPLYMRPSAAERNRMLLPR